MERNGVRHRRINIKDIMFKLRMTTLMLRMKALPTNNENLKYPPPARGGDSFEGSYFYDK
jgi:hypothetical protein